MIALSKRDRTDKPTSNGKRSKAPKAGMTFGVRPSKIRYKGLTVTHPLPAWRARRDVETIIEPEHALERDKLYQSLRNYADALGSPASLRLARQQLGLTKEEFRELIATNKETMSRLERGEQPLEPAAIHLLRLLVNDPRLVKQLEIRPNDLPASSSEPQTPRNAKYSLIREPSIGGADVVLVKAEGLRTHIVLMEAKRHPFYSVVTQRSGVNVGGKTVFRRGPLDDVPPQRIVQEALREHDLDPNDLTWKRIVEAAR